MRNQRVHPIACVVAATATATLNAIVALLEEAGHVVLATASTNGEAIDSVAAHQPDVALLELPPHGVGDLARRATDASPETAVLVHTDCLTPGVATETLQAGARGVVEVRVKTDDLVRAVRAIAGGSHYLDLPGAVAEPSPLSDREMQILLHLADGKSNGEIGALLFLAPDTVRTYVRRAINKLGARTRTQAVATALRRGLIS